LTIFRSAEPVEAFRTFFNSLFTFDNRPIDLSPNSIEPVIFYDIEKGMELY